MSAGMVGSNQASNSVLGASFKPGVNMRFGGFVLSDISRQSVFVESEALFHFVQAVAPHALRKFRCNAHRVLAHNKSKQYAPGGAGHSLRSRRCCWRYVSSLRLVQPFWNG